MCKNICFIIVIISMIFVVNSNSSYAFEVVNIENQKISKPLPKGRNYGTECKVHLNKVSYNQDRIRMDKRNLRKAVVIGAVFGIKFAVGPKEIRRKKSRTSVGVWAIESAGKGTREAMAIAAFRKCENEKSLRQLVNLER